MAVSVSGCSGTCGSFRSLYNFVHVPFHFYILSFSIKLLAGFVGTYRMIQCIYLQLGFRRL